MMLRLLCLLVFTAMCFPAASQAPVVAVPAAQTAVAPMSNASGTFEYAYDDGAANVNIGPPSTFDPDMLWGNYYYTDPSGEIITEIAVAFGSTFPSLDVVTFWLLDDPDADGDPQNATSLVSVEATPDVFGNTFFSVSIPPTAVGGAFFVGASALLEGGADRPARVDVDARADRSWFFYAPDISEVIDDLASAPFGTRMDDPKNVPFPGAFMIRAIGEPSTSNTESSNLPNHVSLSGPYPNPTTHSTSLGLSVREHTAVVVEVFDALGQRVGVLHEGTLVPGEYTFNTGAWHLASGIYLIRIQTENSVLTRTITVLD